MLKPEEIVGEFGGIFLYNNRYRILDGIGKGGFSRVFVAEDMKFGHLVVIKKLEVSACEKFKGKAAIPDPLKFYEEEAKKLTMLSSNSAIPSIIRCWPEPRKGSYFIVMEYIPGKTLAGYLRPKRILQVKEVYDFGIQIASVLADVHRQDPTIIYRDLKPENIIITQRNQQKRLILIDFGIARFFSGDKRYDTSTLGTMGYAPPEQFGSAETNEQSDVYALGAVLHELLTGDYPPDNPFVFDPVDKVQFVPASLKSLIKQMVALKREFRPYNMVDVLKKLCQGRRGFQGLE